MAERTTDESTTARKTWWERLDSNWKALAALGAALAAGAMLVGFAGRYATHEEVTKAVSSNAVGDADASKRIDLLERWKSGVDQDTWWIKQSLLNLQAHQGIAAPPDPHPIAPPRSSTIGPQSP